MQTLSSDGLEPPLNGSRPAAAPPPEEAAESEGDASGRRLGVEAVVEDGATQAEGADGRAEKKKKKKRKHKMRIEHKTLGRVRMKFVSAKGDDEQLQEIAKTFAIIPGVQRVTVNPDTGSVVLRYDHKRHADFDRQFKRRFGDDVAAAPRTDIDELASKIQHEAEFLAQHSDSAKAVLHICTHFDRAIKRRSNNTLDLKMGLAVGLIGLTLIEAGATAATPIWLTLGVFTLNHFLELQQRQQLVEHIKHAAPVSAPVVVKTKTAPVIDAI